MLLKAALVLASVLSVPVLSDQDAWPSVVQTKTANGEFLIELHCGPLNETTCNAAKLSVETVCSYVATDLKILNPIKIQVNFTDFTESDEFVLMKEARPIIARQYSREFSKLGPVVAFPRALAKQAEFQQDKYNIRDSVNSPDVFDVHFDFNTRKNWVFGSPNKIRKDQIDLQFRFAVELTKSLGFKSNLEVDPKSNRTRVSPKISSVKVIVNGQTTEKWYMNYLTQYDQTLTGSMNVGWPFIPFLHSKRLATQFGSFLDIQATFFDSYQELQNKKTERILNSFDEFLQKYPSLQIGPAGQGSFYLEEQNPGLPYKGFYTGGPDFILVSYDVPGITLQWNIANQRFQMKNAMYSDTYLNVFSMLGWGTVLGDNKLVLQPFEDSIKLDKKWGLQ